MVTGWRYRSVMRGRVVVVMSCLAWAGAIGSGTAADSPTFWQSTEAEDYTMDRKEVFEFTKKPVVSRDNDRVTIWFGGCGGWIYKHKRVWPAEEKDRQNGKGLDNRDYLRYIDCVDGLQIGVGFLTERAEREVAE